MHKEESKPVSQHFPPLSPPRLHPGFPGGALYWLQGGDKPVCNRHKRIGARHLFRRRDALDEPGTPIQGFSVQNKGLCLSRASHKTCRCIAQLSLTRLSRVGAPRVLDLPVQHPCVCPSCDIHRLPQAVSGLCEARAEAGGCIRERCSNAVVCACCKCPLQSLIL
jgi:hypothetical protein